MSADELQSKHMAARTPIGMRAAFASSWCPASGTPVDMDAGGFSVFRDHVTLRHMARVNRAIYLA